MLLALLLANTLAWKDLTVTANLDRDGRLHIAERHTIVFNGDWNGGERTFRTGTEEVVQLESITRDGKPLREQKSLSDVATYAWHDANTLRWRSRLPSDPPFQNAAIAYDIHYIDSYVLIPKGGAYEIDHNFGLPDLQWPIEHYSLDLTFDPSWQPSGPFHIERSNLPRGVNITFTKTLAHSGAAPRAVNRGAPIWLRIALMAILIAVAALSAYQFIQRERAVGRFQPLPGPVDRKFIEEHVLNLLPEVVGAAWDDRTGTAEVSAVLARMVQERKLSSRVEKGELVLQLLRDRNELTDYEKALVNGLFVNGNETSTKQVRDYYRSKKSSFNPADKIKAPLQKRVTRLGKRGGAPKTSWKPFWILLASGIALVVGGAFFGPLNLLAAAIAGGVFIALYIGGAAGAWDYSSRLTRLAASSIEFIPQCLLLVAVPIVAAMFRLTPLTLAGLTVLAIAFTRGILDIAKTPDGGERLKRRRDLAAAREYFKRQLRSASPDLDDSWFPYVLAFGLGKNVDRWFRAYGGAQRSSGGFGSSSSTSSSSSGGSGWTGGGGAFGGAGASGGWAVAAGGMAASIAAPGSGGGGGGFGGGGSSGGGGGGGW